MRDTSGTRTSRDQRKSDLWSEKALIALAAFTVMTLLGFSTFGLNPGLIRHVPGAASIYSYAFRFFAVAHVWLAWGVLAFFLTRTVGTRWLPSFFVLYAISLASELLGTVTGLPFGEYSYSPLLNPMWFGHVPIVIPLSWFFMAVPSYALAQSVLPAPERRRARVFLGSAALLSWDLSLDPAMSYATQYWVWASSGAYYGMPWLNLFGWYVTGLALMAALALLRADRWIAALPIRWITAFYLANLALSLGMNVAAGLWAAVGAALVALLAAFLVGRWLGNTRPRSMGADTNVISTDQSTRLAT
ncbi:MAG: carotenoid biosynthesis protein [Gemmatimonadaceae bacterium]